MNDQTDIALIKQDISYIKDEMRSMNRKVSDGYVTMSEFNALKTRVDLFHRTAAYVLIITGLGIVAAILRLVLK